MSVVLTPNSASVDRTGPTWLVESSGYDILANLAPALVPQPENGAFERGRAEVQVAIPQAAHSLEQMVLIKRFHAHAPEADWLQLVAELELASWLRHDNIVRTLGIGLEAGRYFMIKEFLEGATLRACLAWSAASHARLGNVVVAHILLAILDAVKHASAVARSGQSQTLVCAPVAADDVFITYDGQVKLLGFKSVHGRSAAAGAAARPSAIDALLEQQLTRELRRVLSRLARAANDTASDPAAEIRRAFCPDAGATRNAGRAELSSVMSNVLRSERALQALRLAKAFAQLRGPVRRSSALTGREETPPASGLRRISPCDLGGAEPLALIPAVDPAVDPPAVDPPAADPPSDPRR
jgi:hypothetical protein